ncbi:hypothetical protein GE09DRAFT_1189772 [Coniochaeta sp. 2T2.1]|nr:hypothetical protein GE09DRAFT_1189772 [Coniochaeta sp. 2T2.1]
MGGKAPPGGMHIGKFPGPWWEAQLKNMEDLERINDRTASRIAPHCKRTTIPTKVSNHSVYRNNKNDATFDPHKVAALVALHRVGTGTLELVNIPLLKPSVDTVWKHLVDKGSLPDSSNDIQGSKRRRTNDLGERDVEKRIKVIEKKVEDLVGDKEDAEDRVPLMLLHRLAALETAQPGIETLVQTVQALSADKNTLEQRVTSLESDKKALEQRLEKITALDQSVQGLTADKDTLEQRVTSVEGTEHQ